MDSKGYNLFKNNSFLELIIKFNIIYLLLNKILLLFLNFLLGSIYIDTFDYFNIDLANYMFDKNTGEANTSNTTTSTNESKSNPSSSSNSGEIPGGDSAIMATSLAGGYALAQKMPNIAGKVGAVVGGLGLGATQIAAKNLASNMSSDLGKNKLLNWEIINSKLNISDLLGLSGNNGLDMLILINLFQKFSIFLTFLLVYQLLLKYVSPDILVNRLESILPNYLLKFIKETLIKIQKLSTIFIIIFIILILISNYFAHYYLAFYIDNLEQIIEIYFKK
jgi:hypothetical protein